VETVRALENYGLNPEVVDCYGFTYSGTAVALVPIDIVNRAQK